MGQMDCVEKDVEDLVIYENNVQDVQRFLVKIIIRPEISKARHRYFTFCTASGYESCPGLTHQR